MDDLTIKRAEPSSEFYSSIDSCIRGYLQKVVALLDLAELADSGSGGDPFSPAVDEMIANVGEDRRDEVIDFLRKLAASVMEGVKSNEAGDAEVKLPLPDAEWRAFAVRLINDGFLSVGLQHEGRASILRKSLLIVAVSDFEVLLGQLISATMKAVPELLRAEDGSLTLADLESIGNIEDARRLVVERRVDTLSEEGLEKGWIDWFDKRKLDSLHQQDWDSVREVFARRHLMVHTNGKVNANYLRRCKGTKSAVGDFLAVDEIYFAQALESLTVLALKIEASLALKFCRSEIPGLVKSLRTYANQLLTKELSNASEQVCDWSSNKLSAHLQRIDQFNFTVLRLTAMSEAGRWREARTEALEQDLTGTQSDYVLAINALAGNFKEAAKLARSEIASGRLSRYELQTSPLYGAFRASREYAAEFRPFTERRDAQE